MSTTPVDYIISRLKADLTFLKEGGHIDTGSVDKIFTLLSPGTPATSNNTNIVKSSSPVTIPSPVAPLPTPITPKQQVRAIWPYNINNENPADLSFQAGDVFELTPSKNDNDDWWTGTFNGRTAIFPSNHVEKIDQTPAYAPPAHAPPHNAALRHIYSEKPPNEFSQSPPPMQSYNSAPGYQQTSYQQQPYQPPQSTTTTVIVQETDPKKKSKFGKIGGTMGNAAAGGLGFGAGAAIGGGIINSIF